MTEQEIDQKLLDFKVKSAFKQSFNRSELQEIFDLYNLLTMENKPVTTCSSCLSSVISRLNQECRKRKIV